jgi:hypothetical protein
MTTTRTIGPLHPEDLEPHRFEDLVRQLIYDLRSWRSLEATGRTRSDDGFDVRAMEIIFGDGEARQDLGDEDEEDEAPTNTDRVWLVQC